MYAILAIYTIDVENEELDIFGQEYKYISIIGAFRSKEKMHKELGRLCNEEQFDEWWQKGVYYWKTTTLI